LSRKFICRDTHTHNHTLSEQKVKHFLNFLCGEYTSIPISGQTFLRYFERYLKFFAVFKNYLFVPRFLSAQLKILCGALVGKLSSNKRGEKTNVRRKGTGRKFEKDADWTSIKRDKYEARIFSPRE